MPSFRPIPNFDSLSPQTTKGDVISRSTTAAVRVAVGSDGQVLTADSTQSSGVKWAGVSAPAINIVSKTSTYSAVVNDYVLASSASFAITLPTAVGVSGQAITIEHAGTSLSQVYTIHTTSSQTITNAGTTYTNADINTNNLFALYTASEVFTFISDGANWQVQNHITNAGIVSAGAINVSATSAYTFTIPSSAIVAGDVYVTPNGSLFTVTTSGTLTTLTAAGNGAPNAANSTLTRVSGTGAAGPITYTATTSTGQPAIAGGATTNAVTWYRQGKFAVIIYRLQQSAGTVGSGDYVYYLPSGLTLDSSITPFAGSIGTYLLSATGSLPSTVTSNFNWTFGGVYSINTPIVSAYSNNSFRWSSVSSGPTAFVAGSGSLPLNSASVTSMFITLWAPISGWQP